MSERLSAIELPTMSSTQAAKVVRALGAHRYVEGRAHDVHAFVLEAATPSDDLLEARAWARGVLADKTIDKDSRDPRLYRRATDRELAATVASFWGAGPEVRAARDRLAEALSTIDAPYTEGPLFDEAAEDDVYPVLIDAGWQLWPLSRLDPARHQGVLSSYEPFELEAARFEEESAIPPRVYLLELPLLGARELLLCDDAWGDLRDPLVIWSSVEATYEDYLVRGVLRAAAK